MGTLLETAMFLEQEKDITLKDLQTFHEFLTEDIKSQFSDILKNLRELNAKKREFVKNRFKMEPSKFAAKMQKIDDAIAMLAAQMRKLRGAANISGDMLQATAEKAKGAAIKSPRAAAAVGGAAIGGAYALYRAHKAKMRKAEEM